MIDFFQIEWRLKQERMKAELEEFRRKLAEDAAKAEERLNQLKT